MTFSDPYFYLIFLPITLLGYEIFGAFGRRSAIFFLALMSCLFYAKWNKYYLHRHELFVRRADRPHGGSAASPEPLAHRRHHR